MSVRLRTLLGPRGASAHAIHALTSALGESRALAVVDAGGKLLLGDAVAVAAGAAAPVMCNGSSIGTVHGPSLQASALATLLSHLAAREADSRALAAEVLHLYREVHLIEQLSEKLAALLNLPAVADSALAQAQRLITATCGAIWVKRREQDALTCIADCGGTAPLDTDSRFAASVLERGIGEIVNNCAADSRSTSSERHLNALLIAPLRAGQRTVGVIALASVEPGATYSAADLKLLNTIALQTAAAIENALLCEDMVGAARDREQLAAIQHELDTARTIQHLLVPRTFPPFPERAEFDLHAQMTSARAVGGDFFDFFLIDQDRLGLVIGDVSGKGIPAALYMAVTRTQIKTTALRGMGPAACLDEVNRFLVRERVSAMFSTCLYGLLDFRTGQLEYCSAGHNPAYLVRPSAGKESVRPLPEVGGIPLGLFDGMGYTGSTVVLQPGDALFFYTDGVPEAQNRDGDDFTDERLIAALAGSADFSCRDMVGYIVQELAAFTHDAPQSDDITMLALRLRG